MRDWKTTANTCCLGTATNELKCAYWPQKALPGHNRNGEFVLEGDERLVRPGSVMNELVCTENVEVRPFGNGLFARFLRSCLCVPIYNEKTASRGKGLEQRRSSAYCSCTTMIQRVSMPLQWKEVRARFHPGYIGK